MANYEQVTGQAQNIAATPYTPYGGPLVAGINGQQSAGIGAVNSASGLQNPYNAGSGGLAAASASTISPTQFSSSQLQQYENPYQNDVVNATEAEIANQNAQQSAALTGNAVSSGAFGGDRAGVAQAALAGQQDIANNANLAGLNTANFQNAEGEFNTQQQTGLAAAQNTAARQLAASQQLGNLGNTAQTEATPRFAQSEFNAVASHGTPNTTNQPEANHEMVSEMLALGQRNNAFMKDWESAKQQGWASPSAFYQAWDAANPVSGFIRSAQRQIGNFAGMDLPPAEDWAAGSVYVAPAHMTPKTATTLAKYGVKPGTMFRYNGPGNAQPIAPVAKANYFSAQLGQ